MSNRQKNQKGNQSEHTTPISIHNPSAQREHKRNNTPEHADNSQLNPPQLARIKKFLRNKDNQPLVSNLIAFGALFVSIAVGIITLCLFHLASNQSDSVIKSATAAQSAAKTDSETLKATEDYYKQTNSREDAKVKQNIQDAKIMATNENEKNEREKQALGLQIKAIQQGNDQFVKQNRPYLQIEADTEKIGSDRVIIFYKLSNLSSSPVKIIDLYTWGYYGIGEPIFDKKYLSPEITSNYYVIKDAPQTREFSVKRIFTDAQISALRTKNAAIYWWEIVKYRNLVTENDRIYEFKVKLTYDGKYPPYAEFIYNENYDIK